MNQPLVSIITVVRNDVSHIEETMLSVLSQTYSNIEYIVIDGGSTDGTVDIIKKYADKLAYWVSEPDGGIYPAMNKGVEHATGEWVNFMNSGDTFANKHVIEELFVSEISKEIKLVGGNTINFFADGHEETHHAESPSAIPTHLPFSHQASFVRQEICHFDVQYKFAADYALFYEIYHSFGEKSILVFDKAIARYRQEDSLSMGNAKKVKGEYLVIQAKHPNWRWMKEYIKWVCL